MENVGVGLCLSHMALYLIFTTYHLLNLGKIADARPQCVQLKNGQTKSSGCPGGLGPETCAEPFLYFSSS